MEQKYIHTLHVEDDRIQQHLVRRLLKNVLPDHEFLMRCAADENSAVSLFEHHPGQLVLLDYELNQGDGLQCLRRIRQIDRVVPVIALSGKATREVAAQLVIAGADDFLHKDGLSSQSLRDAILPALTRAELVRRRLVDANRVADETSALQFLLAELLEKVGLDWFDRLESLCASSRASRVDPRAMECSFAKAIEGLASSSRIPQKRLRSITHMVFLKLMSELKS